MQTGVESFFPAALGIILLLIVTGALFAAPVFFAFLLAGVLFFAGGLLFGRPRPGVPWGAGLSILAPFLLTSVFLVVTFGSRFLVFPAVAAGGVAAGVGARRRSPGIAAPFLMGALWVGLVVTVALCVVPCLFDRLKIN